MEGTREHIFPKLINNLAWNNSNIIGVEIGVRKGNFSEHLLKNSALKFLYCIDSWSHESGREPRRISKPLTIYKNCIKRLEPYKERCQILRLKSCQAYDLFENNYFDMIYLDAAHTYEDVKEDIKMWDSKLKRKGIFGFHDYLKRRDRKWLGVVEAVNEYAKENDYAIRVTQGDKLTSAWVIKR